MSPAQLISESWSMARLLQKSAQSQLFAIIDPCDNAWGQMFQIESENLTYPLFNDPKETIDPKITPYLLLVTPMMLKRMQQEIQDAHWGLFILASLTVSELSRHLRQYLVVAGLDGTPLFFRFYDPRVLAPFLRVCQPAEITEFFGALDAFLVPSSSFEKFECLKAFFEDNRGSKPDARNTVKPFQLREPHVRAFDGTADLLFLEELQEALFEIYPTLQAEVEPESLALTLRAGLQKARGYGFENCDDIAGFVALMVETAPDFDNYPRAAEIFERDELSPSDKLKCILAELTDEDWEDIEMRGDSVSWQTPDSNSGAGE